MSPKALSLSSADEPEMETSPKTPWKALVLFGLGLYAFVPLGHLAGLCSLSFGARAYHPDGIWRSMIHFLGFWFIGHLVLVFPLSQWVYPREGASMGKARRLSVVTLLLSIPLVSYGYYLGDVRSLVEFQDLLLMVVPAVVLATLVFEECQKPYIFSLALTFFVLPSYVVLNDLLSPFILWVAYASKGPGFYLLRAVTPVAVACLGIVWAWRGDPRQGSGLEHFSQAASLLLVLGIITELGLPLLYLALGTEGARVPGFGWLAYGAVLILIYRKTRLAYYLTLFLSGVEIGVFTYQLLSYFPSKGASFWALNEGALGVCSVIFFGCLFLGLLRKDGRRLFLAQAA